jgi:hypothetical protein
MNTTISKRLILSVLLFALPSLLFLQCNKNEIFIPKEDKETLKLFEVSLEDAVSIAKSFIPPSKEENSKEENLQKTNLRTASTLGEIDKKETIIDEDSKDALFHIITYRKGGFIIVSADLRSMPVFAFSDNEKFDLEQKLEANGFKLWFNMAKEQVKTIKKENKELSSIAEKEWKKYSNGEFNPLKNKKGRTNNSNCQEWYTVGQYICQNSTNSAGPLLATSWGQTGISNFYAPSANCTCGKDPAGCGPVSMGQVLRHIGVNFGGWGSWNFPSMPGTSSYSCSANSQGEQQLASLLRECGRSANSTYHFFTTCNTLTYPSNINDGMRGMGLSNGGNSTSFNPSQLENEVSQNYPVIFCAYDNFFSNWHIWVSDGFIRNNYSEYDCDTHACNSWSYTYYHMNWGWDGSSNGWYAAGNFNPSGTSYNYTGWLSMVSGFRK